MCSSKYSSKITEFISYHSNYFLEHSIIVQDTVFLIKKYGAFNLTSSCFSMNQITGTKTQAKKGAFYTFFYGKDILLSLEMISESQSNITYIGLFIHMFLYLGFNLKKSEEKTYALINLV